MKKILIIGENSYLASGMFFEEAKFSVDYIKRPFNLEQGNKYNHYDYIVNFCIQPEHFTRVLAEQEMIDVQIAEQIQNKNTKYVFLSSRKVYGTTDELKLYKETDELKPFDFYSENKCNIEKKLKEILPDNILILRTGNIIGLPPRKKNYSTFIGWIESELEINRKVIVTINKDAKKDFISKTYFQYVLKEAIRLNLVGIYNVGAGFALSIEELMQNLISNDCLEFNTREKSSEQFILNCDKLHKKIKSFTKEELLNECEKIKMMTKNTVINNV